MKVAVIVKSVFSDSYSSYISTKVLTIDDSKTIAEIWREARINFEDSTISIEIYPVKEVNDDTK